VPACDFGPAPKSFIITEISLFCKKNWKNLTQTTPKEKASVQVA
jgi:hypothetical protein